MEETETETETENGIAGILEEEGLKILNNIQGVELDASEVSVLFAHSNPLELSKAQRAVVIQSLRESRKTYLEKKQVKRNKAAAKVAATRTDPEFLKKLDMSTEDILGSLLDD